MAYIGFDAKEKMLLELTQFEFSDREQDEIDRLRKQFVDKFSAETVRNFKPEDYFPGLGKKEGCFGYELEWGTVPLGSIKGGSQAKFGPPDSFEKIKSLLLQILRAKERTQLGGDPFYLPDGALTEIAQKICAKANEIKGLKSGRTVLGKILSIYYPNKFIPIFTHQDHFLERIVKDYAPEGRGLELFLRNNYLLLEIREGFSDEPAVKKFKGNGQFTNDEFAGFLYSCFPLDEPPDGTEYEALEVHYQKLIHRNFQHLFKGRLQYYDPEIQDQKDGKYDTEEAGEIDILCVDKKNNFVVIELKRKSNDVTVGQICRYMGWVKENLCKPGQKVKGLILSEHKDIRLDYALKAVPAVEYKPMKLKIEIGD